MSVWWDTEDYLISSGLDMAMRYVEDTISEQLLTFVWLNPMQQVENL